MQQRALNASEEFGIEGRVGHVSQVSGQTDLELESRLPRRSTTETGTNKSNSNNQDCSVRFTDSFNS